MYLSGFLLGRALFFICGDLPNLRQNSSSMSPVTHFFAGWLLASISPTGQPMSLTRREKALVVAAAVAPDIDGFGIIPELLTRNTSHPLLWFSQYHHSLHTLAFAVFCSIVAFVIARWPAPSASGPAHGISSRKRLAPNSAFAPTSDLIATASHLTSGSPQPHAWLTAWLVFLSFHLHLLFDLIGARGPEGYQWPIPYLKPFSNALQLTWQGQWALNAWQNFVITGLFLMATLWIAWKHGSSPLELISPHANRAFTQTLRHRFVVSG